MFVLDVPYVESGALRVLVARRLLALGIAAAGGGVAAPFRSDEGFDCGSG